MSSFFLSLLFLGQKWKEAASIYSGIAQGIDTSDAAGRLLRNILIDFAQFEREMISDRVREKRLARAKKGFWNEGPVPYGYITKDKNLIIEPEEAKHVGMIFEIYAKTRSLSTVRKELQLRGIKTKNGKDWPKSSLTRLLANPIYAGKIYENGKHFDGKHKAIIDPDLFFAIQNTLPRIVHTKTRSKRIFLLRGIARCGHHNCGMTPYHARGKNKEKAVYYYRCVKKTEL